MSSDFRREEDSMEIGSSNNVSPDCNSDSNMPTSKPPAALETVPTLSTCATSSEDTFSIPSSSSTPASITSAVIFEPFGEVENDDDDDDPNNHISPDQDTTKEYTTNATTKASSGPCSCLLQLFHCIRNVWVRWTERMRQAMVRAVVATSVYAVQYPRVTLVGIALVSLTLLVCGLLTNFELNLETEVAFTPFNSPVHEHKAFVSKPWEDRIAQSYANPSTHYSDNTYEEVLKARMQGRLQYDAQKKLDEYLEQHPEERQTNVPTQAPPIVLLPEDEEDVLTEEEALQESGGFMDVFAQNGAALPETMAPRTEERRNVQVRVLMMLVHANGKNVLSRQGVHRAFEAMDVVRNLPLYQPECETSNHVDRVTGEHTCEIWGITRFFDHNVTTFDQMVETDWDLIDAIDKQFYPDGGFVDIPSIVGGGAKDAQGQTVGGQAFMQWLFLTGDPALDKAALQALRDFQTEWKTDGSHPYHVEFLSGTSVGEEIGRAILTDLPLIPMVFFIMCLFTCLVFFRCHAVKSRSMLGVGSVITIMMSICSGYGIMFIAGVPLTLLTNIIIFIIIGVGLDDTFIITGEYFRRSDIDDPIKRLEATLDTVGLSIIVTTVTTTVAFCLGITSTIPAIRWLCMYAAPTIVIDFLYQITFFAALLVLDERRIQQGRRDGLVCFAVRETEDDCLGGSVGSNEDTEARTRAESDTSVVASEGVAADNERQFTHNDQTREHEQIADRIMRWISVQILDPWMKIVVLVVFAALFAICCWSTTKIQQKFDFRDLLPKDSYVTGYVTEIDKYSNRQFGPHIVFRFVDQSDPEVQQQMLDFIDDIKGMDAFGEDPPACWIQHYRKFIAFDAELRALPFKDQISKLLEDPRIKDMFGHTILRDELGNVFASSCMIFANDLDLSSVQSQIDFLKDQRAITEAQPINQGMKETPFYTIDDLYFVFEFYNVAAGELAATTVSSIISVCVVAFLFIPHWSAVPIILPMLCVLYVDLLGLLQLFGFSINVVTYVVLVVSIGLLVDLVMHMLLRFYESPYQRRKEKAADSLTTMGASILVGGLSTFLGVLPLIFSTSEILSTVCAAMLAIVGLGLTHGLILLPVLLSYFGPEGTIIHHPQNATLPSGHPSSLEPRQTHHSLSEIEAQEST